MPNRRAVALAAASASLFAWLSWGMIQTSSPTYDEPVHLASGYGYLVSGPESPNYRDHPAFGEAVDALPLLFFKPRPAFSAPDLEGRGLYDFADLFLYKNAPPADRMLNAARLWSAVLWGSLLAAAVVLWSLRLAGIEGAAAAALLFAFCPVLLSNLSLTTTDAPSCVFYFLTFWILSIRPRRTGVWLGAGAACGLALACKFNMIALPALAALVLAAEAAVERKAPKPSGVLLAALAGAAVLLVVYRLHGLPLYWTGLTETLARVAKGRMSFLMGAYSTNGNLFYFPVALALKTPLPILGWAAVGIWRRRKELWLLLPPTLYFGLACVSKTLIGVRHILPVYPFLIVLAASGAGWAWTRGTRVRAAVLLSAVWLVAGVLRVQPHQLAYFNELAGGPAGGWRYLVDSNLDWGQDLPELAGKLREIGNPPVVMSYFGVGDPAFYGIRRAPLGLLDVTRREGVVEPDGAGRVLFAISASHLQCVNCADHQVFAWLKSRKPLFTAGWSIFVYDLTDDPDGARRLAGLLMPNGYPRLATALQARYGTP